MATGKPALGCRNCTGGWNTVLHRKQGEPLRVDSIPCPICNHEAAIQHARKRAKNADR